MHIWSNPLHHSFSRQLCAHTHAHAHTNPNTHPQPREQLGARYQTVGLKCRILENNRAASQEPHPSDQLSSSHNHHTTQSLQYRIAIPIQFNCIIAFTTSQEKNNNNSITQSQQHIISLQYCSFTSHNHCMLQG